MSATSAPFGFRPAFSPTGLIRPIAVIDGIASGYATNIFAGNCVKLNNGVIEAVTAGSSDFIGVFAGCSFTPVGGRPTVATFFATQTTYDAGTMTAYYYSDPTIVYEVQADGSLAQTSIGDQADVTNFTAGNTTTGLGASTLNSSLVGSGSQGQWRIVNLAPSIGPSGVNAWGDAYTVVQVQIARSQYIANKVAV